MSVRRSRNGGSSMRKNIQPVIKVLAKTLFLDHLQQVAVRRRDDADVDVDLLDAADAADLFFLKRAQDLCLQRDIELADLIQEQRAVVRDLEQALFLGDRPGKRSFFVTEQLGFEQVLVDRGAVYGLKHLVRAQAVFVDRAGDQLLSGPALAADKNRRV